VGGAQHTSPAEHHPAGMLPVTADFHRLLRIKLYNDWRKECDAVLRVPSVKLAFVSAPTAQDQRRLAHFKLSLKAVLNAQHMCFDVETLIKLFASHLKQRGDG